MMKTHDKRQGALKIKTTEENIKEQTCEEIWHFSYI